MLVGFTQPDNDTIVLTFDRQLPTVEVRRFISVPTRLDSDFLRQQPADVVRSARTVVIGLDEKPSSIEHSIVVSLPSECSGAGCPQPPFLELIRQPAGWLEHRFSFQRPAGYTILERRTIDVQGSGERPQIPDLLFSDAPDRAVFSADVGDLPNSLSRYPEVLTAARIVRTLWAQPARTGPTSLPYSDFMAEPFAKELSDVREGRFSIECQGMRDLFLHASLAFPGLKARAVDAVDYAPPFKDLIAVGHSTAEIWVSALQKWVIVDPWEGFVVARDGVLLSSAEIAESSSDIASIPLVDKIEQFLTSDASHAVVRKPGETRMVGFQYTAAGSDPGYATHFVSLQYHSVHFRQ